MFPEPECWKEVQTFGITTSPVCVSICLPTTWESSQGDLCLTSAVPLNTAVSDPVNWWQEAIYPSSARGGRVWCPRGVYHPRLPSPPRPKLRCSTFGQWTDGCFQASSRREGRGCRLAHWPRLWALGCITPQGSQPNTFEGYWDCKGASEVSPLGGGHRYIRSSQSLPVHLFWLVRGWRVRQWFKMLSPVS